MGTVGHSLILGSVVRSQPMSSVRQHLISDGMIGSFSVILAVKGTFLSPDCRFGLSSGGDNFRCINTVNDQGTPTGGVSHSTLFVGY